MSEWQPITVSVPLQITPEMIRAVRDNALTSVEDKDEWYTRLGWLICAWDVLLESSPAIPPPPAD